MSKQIDLNKKLSEKDIYYLLSRDQHRVIAFNAVMHGTKLPEDVAKSIRARGITREEVQRAVDNAKGVSEPDVDDVDDDETPDTGPEKFSDEWFISATVENLKAELKERKLPVSGTRPELVSRLEESLLEEEDDEEDDDTA